ncbi:MAG: hypothetical protein Q7R76_00605 [Candidatus Woesearchaeota archaeon]|nr:hypothetical protein [Candidatus Woesearchaeota archaeon]
MADKKQIMLARVHHASHKGITSTRGFLAPVKGKFKSNLQFEANMNLSTNDVVEFYMEKGEPIVVRKVKSH